jgi:hypothetical protein
MMKFFTTTTTCSAFSTLSSLLLLIMAAAATTTATANAEKITDGGGRSPYLFIRIATFNICEQIDVACNTDIATNAETVWYFKKQDSSSTTTEDYLVYTNSESQNLGFVDITNPTSPKAAGEVDLGGEPTTVRVIGNYGTFIIYVNNKLSLVALILLT